MQNTLVHIMAHILCSGCMCYSQSVSFIEFCIDFCMHDKTCVITQNTTKTLLQFKNSKLGQILHVDKTCFSGPVTYN